MAFEILRKKDKGNAIGDWEMSVRASSLTFGKAIVEKAKGCGYLGVYLDKEGKRVGFIPTEDKTLGFRAKESKNGKLLYAGCKEVSKRVPGGRYAVTEEDGLLAIHVEEIASDDDEE